VAAALVHLAALQMVQNCRSKVWIAGITRSEEFINSRNLSCCMHDTRPSASSECNRTLCVQLHCFADSTAWLL